ncbi:hypothetical protein EJB05_22744, partial [Eragrostis curvula]
MENGCGNATVYVVLDEDITEPVLALYEFAFMVPQRAPFFRTRKVKVSCDKRAAVNRFSSPSKGEAKALPELYTQKWLLDKWPKRQYNRLEQGLHRNLAERNNGEHLAMS